MLSDIFWWAAVTVGAILLAFFFLYRAQRDRSKNNAALDDVLKNNYPLPAAPSGKKSEPEITRPHQSHMVRCHDGHYFDSKINSKCPFCSIYKESIHTRSGDTDGESITTWCMHAPSPSIRQGFVEFNAFAPNRVLPGSSFLISLWAHQISDYESVHKYASDLGNGKNIGRKSAVPVAMASKLSITVCIDGMTIPDHEDEMGWNGLPVNCAFPVECKPDCRPGLYSGVFYISTHGLLLAKLRFCIDVGPHEEKLIADRSESLEFIKSAFASYATLDRLDVLKRIQGIKTVCPDIDIFMDVLNLRAGHDWERKLEQHVPSKDVFFLFWSKHAVQSKWVEREWRLAMARRGIEYIHPVPLVDPRYAPVPEELSALHFSDPELLLMHSHST